MKQLKGSHLFLIVVALAIICASLVRADDNHESNSQTSSSSEEVQHQANKDKRPFCNAFAGDIYQPIDCKRYIIGRMILTGCGRKRATLVKEMQNIALGRALPAYAYYSKSDLKLLQELFAKYKQQLKTDSSSSSSEEDEDSKH